MLAGRYAGPDEEVVVEVRGSALSVRLSERDPFTGETTAFPEFLGRPTSPPGPSRCWRARRRAAPSTSPAAASAWAACSPTWSRDAPPGGRRGRPSGHLRRRDGDPRGRRLGGGRRRRRLPRLVCRRDGDDRAARRWACDLLGRRRGAVGTSTASSPFRPRGRRDRLVTCEVPFGAELVHYAIGACLVRRSRALPAGLDELWSASAACPGRGSSSRRLTRTGRRRLPSGARGLPGDARAGDDDGTPAPGSTHPAAHFSRRASGSDQPGLVHALGSAPRRAPQPLQRGSIAERCSSLVEDLGGVITRADLDALRSPLGRRRTR